PGGIWLISFMQYDLGYIDLEQRTLQTIDNPFGTKLSPMSPVQTVTYVSGSDNLLNGDPCRTRTCDHRLRRPVLYPAELRGLPRSRRGGGGVMSMGPGLPAIVAEIVGIGDAVASRFLRLHDAIGDAVPLGIGNGLLARLESQADLLAHVRG